MHTHSSVSGKNRANQHAGNGTGLAKRAAAAPGATSGAEPSAGPASAAPSREDRIREAAFAFYEARGGEPGHELEDWLQAEALVEARLASPVP